MSYQKSFVISEPVGNNALSFQQRKSHPQGVTQLTVPALKQGTMRDLQLGNEIVFQDFDEFGELQTCMGLKNFIQTKLFGAPVYIFDNHNHAFYFWHRAAIQGIIPNNITLLHVDQHSDMRQPLEFLSSEDATDTEKLYRYTNRVLNVGNFIIPAQKTGLISNVIQIRGRQDIKTVVMPSVPCILDLDLDFFAPELDYIDFDTAKAFIQKIATKAALITVATSPFFMDQKYAIDKLQKLFDFL